MSICEPQDIGFLHRAGVDGGKIVERLDARVEEGDGSGVIGGPDVAEDFNRLICTPEQAAGHECQEQEDAVDELEGRAGERELVAEPVDIQEGRRKLVKDKGRGVEVDEGSLDPVSCYSNFPVKFT